MDSGAEVMCESPFSPSLLCLLRCPGICSQTRPEVLQFLTTEKSSWRTDVAISLPGSRPSRVTMGGKLAENKMLPALGPCLPLLTSAQDLMVI